MSVAKEGDNVEINYLLEIDGKLLFDGKTKENPLKFQIGEGKVIPGVENAVIGMKPGETKTVEVSPDQAYGPFRQELVQVVNRDQLPPDLNVEIGQQLEAHTKDGSQQVLTVIEATDSTVTLDGNHPLAGKQLTFTIDLKMIA